MKKLFSIILLIVNWQMIFAEGISKEEERTAWNSINAKFMGRDKTIDIFQNDIAIKLEGNVSHEDSTCMNELIDQLKVIIPGKKIYLTENAATLFFNFTDGANGLGENAQILRGSIKYRQIDVKTGQNFSKEFRKKMLYFKLFRSLVHFSPSSFTNTVITGCVFDENSPEKITYSPFDAFILNKLYSKDFMEQFENEFISRTSFLNFLKMQYPKELNTLFSSLGYICAFILITLLLAKRVFKPGRQSWSEFNKQGALIILIWIISRFGNYLTDLSLDSFEIKSLGRLIIRAIIAVNMIFLIERLIFRKQSLGQNRVLIIFTVTLFVLTLFSLTEYKMPFRWSNIFAVLSYLGIPFYRSLFIFLSDRYNSIINEKDVQLAKISELHKQAELQSLQAKINPHFLYNALNSIASLATSDAKKTEQMALGLSDFFKYSINREQKQFNALSEELNAIRTYLEIEKVRYGDRLNFEIECPEELLNVQIPQLLIQPLVENAIKHGLSKITEKGLIRIIVSKEEKQLKIRIYDNGPAFPEGPLSGYGIQNTQERITLLYGGKASINWHNGDEKFIEISLPIN
jgi:two-component system, LytTR family, sensor kinase